MLTKSIEVNLARPLQPVQVEEQYTRLCLIVLWEYLPLGLIYLPCSPASRTFSPEELQSKTLQTLGWQLWQQAVAGRLAGLRLSQKNSLPPISVVVCTCDRPTLLERCLQKLAQLDYPAYEVIVVDNGSVNSTVALLARRRGFRYIREPIPGLDRARNKGRQAARYDIIAYIDDDALATPGWLRGVAHGFEDPAVMAVTGLVLPAELETPAQHYFEAYGGMSKGFTGRTIRRQEISRGSKRRFWASAWGVGANMAFRKQLFEQIGGFDIALDVGTPAGGGGDIEFFYRTVASGHALRYEPAALVYHLHRRDEAALRQQIYNNGRAFAAYLLTIARNEPQQRPAILRFALRWWIWSWLLKQLFGAFIKRRNKWAFRLALAEIQGAISSVKAYHQSQKLAHRLGGSGSNA